MSSLYCLICTSTHLQTLVKIIVTHITKLCYNMYLTSFINYIIITLIHQQ